MTKTKGNDTSSRVGKGTNKKMMLKIWYEVSAKGTPRPKRKLVDA